MKSVTKALMLPFITVLFILNIAMVSLPTETNNNFWWPIDIAGVVVCLTTLIMIHVSCHNEWKKMDKKEKSKLSIKSCMIQLIMLIFWAWVIIMMLGECGVTIGSEVISVLRGLNWLMLGMTSYLFVPSLTCFIIKKISA